MRAFLSAPLPCLLLAATATMAEPVTATCALYATAEVCDCATGKLGAALSPGDLVLYATAASEALALQAAGTELVPAWEAATGKAAAAAGLSRSAARDKLNEAGAAHREAMKACEG